MEYEKQDPKSFKEAFNEANIRGEVVKEYAIDNKRIAVIAHREGFYKIFAFSRMDGSWDCYLKSTFLLGSEVFDFILENPRCDIPLSVVKAGV